MYGTGINTGGFKSLSTSNVVRRFFTCMFYFLKLGNVGATGEGYVQPKCGSDRPMSSYKACHHDEARATGQIRP